MLTVTCILHAVYATFLIGGMVLYASAVEWTLHRYVMHQPLGAFRYPFTAHALTHHVIFKADRTYHLSREKDKETIPMAWWNGPVLVLLATLPFFPFVLLHAWPVPITALIVLSLYYGMYEYLHWCMHLPQKRRVERTGIFFRLNGHHLLHHRYMNKNFNVVCPFADLVCGTLLTRSKTRFRQAEGPSLPDVQPKGTF